ncbi:MAG: cupredoxin domain-containing protein [Nitrospiraceae bacterium]
MNWRILYIVISINMLAAWPGEATPPQLQITIENGSPYFVPAAAIAPAGTSIRWDNPTPTHHTITHNGCIDGTTCMFDSGTVDPDGTYSIPGLPPGRYPYHCQLHPIMRGILTVTDQPSSPSQT